MAKYITVDLNKIPAEGQEINARGKNTIRIDGLTAEQAKKADYKVVGKNLEITVEGKKLVVNNYGGIRYIGTEKVETKGYDLYDIISNSKVENTNVIKYDNTKKRLIEGTTKYNDTIDLSDYVAVGSNLKRNRGVTVNGGDGNDTIMGTDYNDTIKGGNGDDTITGGKGNDTIVGGTGTNVINYTKGDGDDTVFLTKGENFTLNLNDLELSDLKFEYANRNRDLKISYSKDNETGSITLKNFARSNVTNNATRRNDYTDTSSVEFNIGGETYDLRSNQKDGNYWFEVKPVGNFSGGWQNDHINATETAEQLNRRRQHVDLVLNGGAGDDLIESSMFADRISGGAGKNTIKYTSLEQLSGDKIYLTRGENVTVDISAIDGATAKYAVNGRNLDVTVTKGEESKTFTLINFGTKDVTNNKTRRTEDTSSVELKLSDSQTVDLRDVVVNSQNGTWHNDYIDRSDYTLYKDRAKTIVQNDTTKRGLTLNGGNGDDTIIGTNYSDKIYGDNGDDIITGGTGNDIITGGAGNNTLIFSANFGNDTVNLTKGENVTLDFSSFNIDDISKLKFEYANRDLKISVPNGKDVYGTVTLKNYVRTDVVGDKGSVNIKLNGEKTVNLADDDIFKFTKDDFSKNKNGAYIFTGSRFDETIDATGLNNTVINAGNGKNTVIVGTGDHNITTGSGDDEIKISGDKGGYRTIKAGGGHNTITVDNRENFGNITVAEQNVKAKNDIIFTNDISQYSIYKKGNNLELNKDAVTLMTVNDYFSTNKNKAETTFILNDKRSYGYDDIESLANRVKEFMVSGSDSVYGTNSADKIKTDDALSDTVKPCNDNIYAGKGDDVINAGRGRNNIYFYQGDGHDEIVDGGGVDTLVFKGGTNVNTQVANDNGVATLTIYYGQNDTITVNNYSKEHSVRYIKVGSTLIDLFNNKTTKEKIPATVKKETSETEPDNASTKSNVANNTVVNVPSPTDIPDGMNATPFSGYSIRGTNEDDILVGTSGDDWIKGLSGNDTIYGGAGNDYLSGGAGDDKIYGGKGNDALFGGDGHNTFYFANGDGRDSINEPGADNTLYFFGLKTAADLKFSIAQDPNGDRNLVISGYGSTNDNITISQFLTTDGYTSDYSHYKLQTDGQDTVSLYNAVMNSSDISAEIKQEISGFMSRGKDTGIDTQAIISSNNITAEAILTTGTTTPQM